MPLDFRKLALLPKVGFWRPNDTRYCGPGEESYPTAESAVDPSWVGPEREAVLAHVQNGDEAAAYRGWSDCRICGKMNGSVDLTDGAYVWPEGFAHYIAEHGVKPPQDFIDHCLRVARTKP